MKDCRIKRTLDGIGYDKLLWLVKADLTLIDSDTGEEIPRKLIEIWIKDKEEEASNEH